MSALAFRPATPATRRAKVLLIGEPGVGKTHVALTFPKPAVIDAEGSSDWFADRFEFSAVATKSYEDARKLLGEVRAGRVPCETVVIDSLTSIYNGLLNATAANREDFRPLDWGRIKRKFSQLLDELYHKLDKNVVCIGWIKPEYAKPGDVVHGKTVTANDLVKIGEAFDGDRKTMYAFDFVFKIEGNDGKRTKATVIKSRSGALVAGQVIPDFSWATIAKLMPQGDHKAEGMSDDEQVARDAEPDPELEKKREAVSRAVLLGVIPGNLKPEQAASALRAWAMARNAPSVTAALEAYEADLEAEAKSYLAAPPYEDDEDEPPLTPIAQVDATMQSRRRVLSADEREAQARLDAAAQKAKPTELQRIKAMAAHNRLGHDDDMRHDYYEQTYGVRSFGALTRDQASELIDMLERQRG